MKTSEKGLALLKRFEGCSLTAYQDRVGVWTIGYGTTSADKALTGKTIKRGLTISKDTAESWLRKAVDSKYGPKVAKYDSIYHWTQNEFDALVSFCYNLGSIDQLTDNGKRSKAEIAEAMPLYNKAGGKYVKGLAERREAERKLFRTPDSGVDDSGAANVNYRKQVAAAAKKVYPKCVGRKHGSGVQKRVTNLQQFLKQKELNCHLMVSLALQEAGCLPKGCVITHTAKGNGKKCVSDAVKGTEKLKHCNVYWVNRLYKDLPEKYKQAGVVYIQNSNACVSAGNGKIWSCNKSVGYKYKYKGDYLRTEGYPFSSKILVVVMPEE